MAIAHVQSVGDNAKSLAYSGAVSAGNFLVSGISTAGVITDFDDTVNGDWGAEVIVEDGQSASLLYAYIFAFLNTGAGTPTVSFAGGFDNFEHMGVAEFSGVATTDALDQTNSGIRLVAETAVTSGTISTPGGEERLLIGVVANESTRTFAPDTGWTEMYDGADNSRALSFCYRIVSDADDYAMTGELSGVAAWSACIASFKPAAAASGQPAVKRFGGVQFGPGFAQNIKGMKGW
mgnify:CR=1 FL=1